MNKRFQKPVILLAIIFVGLVIISSALFLGSNKENSGIIDSKNSTTNTENSNQTVKESSGTKTISQEELAKHNVSSDCWIAYSGKVYDVTAFLPKHPGSAGAIIPYCGTASEFEKAFLEQHGTTKAGFLMKVATFMGDFSKMGSLA